MSDLTAIGTFVVMFIAAALYVHGCDRLKGASNAS